MPNQGHTSCGANWRVSPSAVATSPCTYVFTHVVDTRVQGQVPAYCPLPENPWTQKPYKGQGCRKASSATHQGIQELVHQDFSEHLCKGYGNQVGFCPSPGCFCGWWRAWGFFQTTFSFGGSQELKTALECLLSASASKAGPKGCSAVLRATLWPVVYLLTPPTFPGGPSTAEGRGQLEPFVLKLKIK